MLEQALEKSETKTCESCGANFTCGAKTEKCWCFSVDLRAETLAELRDSFKNCLCKNCLSDLNRDNLNCPETNL